MNSKQVLGQRGEDIACIYLRKKGYQILERNFKCRYGEVDIIAKKRDEVVFIEVKTRTGNSYGNPIDAVDGIKQKHIYKTAEYYLYIKHLDKKYVRIDVIEVYASEENAKINHVECVL